MSVKNWKLFTPFYFYTSVCIVLGIAAARSEESSIARIALLLVGGLISWTIIEYCLHRFIFHYEAQTERTRTIVYNMHIIHHDYPKAVDDLFAGLQLSVPIASFYFLASWMIAGSWQAAVFLFIGMIAGYFAYEWTHYQVHHGNCRSRVMQYLKRYHMLHHYQAQDLRFGVTTPLIDLLFGTYGPAKIQRGKE
jgi:sterol desaturase/sphingolipid hydroxylase (fatty acid hydroxylase superfamily)